MLLKFSLIQNYNSGSTILSKMENYLIFQLFVNEAITDPQLKKMAILGISSSLENVEMVLMG